MRGLHANSLLIRLLYGCLLAMLIWRLPESGAVLPANEQWREALLGQAVGYGRNATGGAGGTLCTVSNLNNTGAGSLRACATASGPQWIVFSLSGTITLTSAIRITSDKTVDGRGQDISIANFGFEIGNWSAVNPDVSNVIIHNLKFINATGSGVIEISEDASNIWIDHNTINNGGTDTERIYIGSNGSDGRTGAPPTAITISWNRFPQNLANGQVGDKSILVSDPTLPGDAATTMTLHHNYHLTYNRLPFARYAKMHAFNNFFHLNEGGVQISAEGRYYSENDVFEGPYAGSSLRVDPDPFGPQPGDETPAANVKVLNPYLVLGDETYQQLNEGTIFNPASDYSYTAETANAALRTAIINGAGWQNVSAPVGTVALYHLDEGTGTTANDSSASGTFDGTLQNSPTWTTGKLDDGLSFNGSTQYVSATSPNLSGALTLAVWVNASALTGLHTVLANYDSGATGAQFEISILADGAWFYTYLSGGNGRTFTTATGQITTSTWIHLSVTDNGADSVQLYQNGSTLSSTPTGTFTAKPTSPPGGLALGRAGAINDQYFAGAIDEVYLMDTVASGAEITALATVDPVAPAAPTNLRVMNP